MGIGDLMSPKNHYLQRDCPIVLALVTLLVSGPALAETPRPGDPAPAFTMATLNPEGCGQPTFSLKRVVGPTAQPARAALVLSFGASYCQPCKAELPELARLAAELRDQDVQFVLVVIDTEEEGIAAMSRLAIEELALPFPVLGDRFEILARRYGATELPFLALVDGTGRLRWVQRGFAPGSLAALRAELATLLGPAAAEPLAPATPKAPGKRRAPRAAKRRR